MEDEKVINLVDNLDESTQFWKITICGTKHIVRHGKCGQRGRPKVTKFDNKKKCLRNAMQLVEEQKKKGFKEVNNIQQDDFSNHKNQSQNPKSSENKNINSLPVEEPSTKKRRIDYSDDNYSEEDGENTEETKLILNKNKIICFENDNDEYFKLNIEGKKVVENKGKLNENKITTKNFQNKQMAMDYGIKLCNEYFGNGFFIVEENETGEKKKNEENEESEDKNAQRQQKHMRNYNDIKSENELFFCGKNNLKLFENPIEIDDNFPYKEKCNVYCTPQYTYNLNLHIDNKYYRVQLLTTNSRPYIYYSWFRWGQINNLGSNVLFGPENDPSNCIEQFHQNVKLVLNMLKNNTFGFSNFEIQIGDNNADNPINDYCNNWNCNQQNDNYIPKTDPNVNIQFAYVREARLKARIFIIIENRTNSCSENSMKDSKKETCEIIMD